MSDTPKSLTGYIILKADEESPGHGPAQWPMLSVMNKSDDRSQPIPVNATSAKAAINKWGEGLSPEMQQGKFVAVPERSFTAIQRTVEQRPVVSVQETLL
jgi:hypothetical protein